MTTDTPRTNALVKSGRPFAGSELAEQAFDKMSYLARTLERELAGCRHAVNTYISRIAELKSELAEASRRIEELEFGPWKVK